MGGYRLEIDGFHCPSDTCVRNSSPQVNEKLTNYERFDNKEPRGRGLVVPQQHIAMKKKPIIQTGLLISSTERKEPLVSRRPAQYVTVADATNPQAAAAENTATMTVDVQEDLPNVKQMTDQAIGPKLMVFTANSGEKLWCSRTKCKRDENDFPVKIFPKSLFDAVFTESKFSQNGEHGGKPLDSTLTKLQQLKKPRKDTSVERD
ncbi:hypothetical protein Trydic_g17826 [Trypoxylus dichotomus]